MSCLHSVRSWLGLGLPPSILETHPECVDYLVKSRIVYPLAGYGKQALKLENEHLLLKVEGIWRHWEEVKDLLQREEWCYTSLDGILMRDRLHYKKIFPVHSLSTTQYEKVHEVALRYFTLHGEVDPGIEKNCVLQLITTSLTNANAPFALEHCTIRVLRPVENHVEVYSFGAEMAEDQYLRTMPHGTGRSWMSRSILTTVETKIGMGDFMEFREANLRRVTSIPLTSIRADKILQRVDRLSQSHLRFNYIGQNCLALAHEVMQETGYDMPDIHMTLGQLLSATCLDRQRHPYLAAILEHENRISMVISNCATLVLGGLKMSEPLPEGTLEEPIGRSEGIHSFSRLIRSPWSLLTENCSRINYHSLPFIAWQLEQPSTQVIPATPGRPQMYGL
jgi:hypothetical protein